MNELTLLLIFFLGIFLVMLFTGWLIAFCLAAASVLAYLFIGEGIQGNLPVLEYAAANRYTLLALPIFILMGEILIEGGVAAKLYDAVVPFMERFPGGLIHTNVLANVILGAMCGSTVAATSAISSVAIPELAKRGYEKKLCYGSLAAAGNLAGLIPPSIGLILYAAITEVSLGQLFIAGIIPGLALAATIMLVTAILVRVNPKSAPSVAKEAITPLGRSFILAVKNLWPVAILVALVLGTIYFGIATPTESASYGVVGALALSSRRLNWRRLKIALFSATRIGAALLFLIGMAIVYGYALNILGLTGYIVTLLGYLPGEPWLKVFLVWCMLLPLGMFLESGSVMIITTPILLPFVVALGYDPVWYGVWIVLAIELGNITPPVGLTIYAVQAVSGDQLDIIAKGTFPYWASFLITQLTLTFFPVLALWLPSTGFG